VVDPGETVTVTLNLSNIGSDPTTNLVATLQANANVISPSGPQNYGALAPGGTAGRTFTFTANGSPGDVISLTLQLQDGAQNMGTVTFNFTLGNNRACAGTPKIVILSTLSCSAGGTLATVTITNNGTATATNVMLTTAKLGAIIGTPLPQSAGTLLSGASTVLQVTFSGAPSGVQTLQLGGTHSAGSFSSSKKVNAPSCSP
jgi:hypothetical protein